MNKYKFLLILLLSSLITNGQTCFHKNLSKTFNFKIELKRIKADSCKITLIVIEKKTLKNIQTIKLYSEFIFENDFKDCATVRSYTNGINKNRISIDNDFGDFIVADFNFDGKEDFAIKKDSGGNGGPVYSYFIQNNNSKFIFDNYLSNTMEFFPRKINNTKKTLTTLVHANAYEKCKKVYKYNSKTRKWKVISKTFVK